MRLSTVTDWLWQVDVQGVHHIIHDGAAADHDQTRNGVIELVVAANPMIFWLPRQP